MRIIDTHCHIYPDKIAEKASLATGRFYDLPASMDGSIGTLLERGKAAGIDHFVINSVATTPKQVHAINTFIAETVAQGKGKFTGLGTLQQDLEDPEEAVDEILSLGLKGIKLHPDIQGFRIDDERAVRFFEIVRGRLPFLLHLGDKRYDNSNPNRVKPILEAFPDTLFIGAHFGGWSIWSEASRELYKYENLVVDCSSALYGTGPEKATELVRLYGADRVLFGTDYPLWDPVKEVELFFRMKLTDSEFEKICFANAARLYGIGSV
ncbi:MAG: amidohydrolase [Clostridia bacterium]|nr:amidohydrolase [Clostridia bacterium]